MIKKDLVFRFFSEKSYYEKVFRSFCFLFSDPEEAKDATQEIFLRLARNAENTNFPEDDAEAMNFVRKVALNYFFETLRKRKGKESNSTDELKTEITEAEGLPGGSCYEKLDILNGLIVKRAHFFTERQLQLWDCMYKCLPVKEIMEIMKCDRQAIYSLKNKLKSKIREHVMLEELFV